MVRKKRGGEAPHLPTAQFSQVIFKRNPKEEKRRVVQKSGLTLEKQGVGKREHSLRVQILRRPRAKKSPLTPPLSRSGPKVPRDRHTDRERALSSP